MSQPDHSRVRQRANTAADLLNVRDLSSNRVIASLNRPGRSRMSWSELERLVEQAEADARLRRALMHCRSQSELVLASRRLGFGIDADDLRLAWQLHQQPSPGALDNAPTAPLRSGGADRYG